MAHVSPSLVHSLHFEDISHHCTVKSLVCVVLGADLREPGLEWYVVLNVIFFYPAPSFLLVGSVNVNVNLDSLDHGIHHTSQVTLVGAPALSSCTIHTNVHAQPSGDPSFRAATLRKGAACLPRRFQTKYNVVVLVVNSIHTFALLLCSGWPSPCLWRRTTVSFRVVHVMLGRSG